MPSFTPLTHKVCYLRNRVLQSWSMLNGCGEIISTEYDLPEQNLKQIETELTSYEKHKEDPWIQEFLKSNHYNIEDNEITKDSLKESSAGGNNLLILFYCR